MKIIYIFILSLLLNSCANLLDIDYFTFDEVDFRNTTTTIYSKDEKKYVTYLTETTEQKISAICIWVFNNIEYDEDLLQKFKKNPTAYYRRLPQTILNERKGICVDFSILIGAIAHYQLKIDINIVSLAKRNEYGILDIINRAHAISSYNSLYFDGTWGGTYSDKEYLKNTGFEVYMVTNYSNVKSLYYGYVSR